MTHRSQVAEQLHLGRSQFSREVVIQVGYWRFWHHLTVSEIHQRLHTDLRLPISEREILPLLGDFLALLRAAQPAKIAAFRPHVASLGGLVLGLDGLQPEKGNRCLYVLRDPRLGITWRAESLEDSSAATLQQELLEPLQAWIKQLDLPLLGIVSDAQESIRLAVAAAFPDVPHHCCHFHCLRDAGALTFQADRRLKKALKKALRQPLGRIAARLQKLPAADPFRPILEDYTDAVRSTLLEGGVAPFALGGLRVFADLTDLSASLSRCQKKGGIRSWTACYASPSNASPSRRNATNWRGSGSGSSTWNTSWIPKSPRSGVRTWPTRWSVI